jgi:hypothetical protein
MESISGVQQKKIYNIEQLFSKMILSTSIEYLYPKLRCALNSFHVFDIIRVLAEINYVLSLSSNIHDNNILQAIKYEFYFDLEK